MLSLSKHGAGVFNGLVDTSNPTRAIGRALALALALFPFSCEPVEAFVTLRPKTIGLEASPRWSAAPHELIGGAGLYDGIHVAVAPELAEMLAIAVTGEASPEDVADIEDSVHAAFAAWESSVLRLDVELDGLAERGGTAGAEIDLFLASETDPVFSDNDFFGVTFTSSERIEERVLTNGTVLPGFAIAGADVFLNTDMLRAIAVVLTREQQLAALQRLIMHETGHALGFHHPNEFSEFNYDTDIDPLNEMAIDPDDPLAGLMLSPNIDDNAVMSNLPAMLDSLFFTSLRNDERGGRDALYPGPPLATCPADCNGDANVSIDELVHGVGIALSHAFFLDCPAADPSRDRSVTVDELIAGVGAALEGCPDARA